MWKRYLNVDIQSMALKRNKMALLSGPRQVGKTTLAKSISKDFSHSLYKNWDEPEFRRLWTKSPNQLAHEFELSKVNQSRLLILDEIHKSLGWKRRLKGLYDEIGSELSILVTGSARLNIFKKGSDSLMGRYLNFRLHPLSYGELLKRPKTTPENWKASLINRKLKASEQQKKLDQLLKFSGFPEPFFAGDEKLLRVWRRGRLEKIVREDLRDLSRLPELSQVEMLMSLMPSKVGSPLSVQSLREDLEVSFDTVKRWLNYLQELYYHFEIRPWTNRIARTLKKEPKIYLFDWTEIDDPGARFENLIACHLLKACHYWTDTGEGDFQLFYLRNKEKQEVDFLIVKNKKPWLAIESKSSTNNTNEKSITKFQSQLNVPFIQVISESGHFKKYDQFSIMSATVFLEDLP